MMRRVTKKFEIAIRDKIAQKHRYRRCLYFLIWQIHFGQQFYSISIAASRSKIFRRMRILDPSVLSPFP